MRLVHLELPEAVWNVWSELKHEAQPIKNTDRDTSVIYLSVAITPHSHPCWWPTLQSDAPALPGIIMMEIQPQKAFE